jgi:Outer membrane protein beta-barrel domain
MNMKTRPVFLMLSLVAMSLTKVEAQGFHLGIKGGTNISQINGQSFDQSFKFGYSLGAFAELNINKKWGLQPELLWNQSKTTTTDDFNLIYQGVSGQNITLNYLSIPILLTYKPIPLLSLQIGPQFGILLDQSANLFQNGENAFKKGDFSILGGAQLNFGGFRAGARYYIQLNNINDLPNAGDDATWKSEGFQLYVGIRII